MNVKGLFANLMLVGGLWPLQAQATQRGLDQLAGTSPQVEMGIQGFLVLPQGDLRRAVDGTDGLQLGVHGALGMAETGEWRPRIDYTRLDGGSSATTMQGVSLGLDYLDYFGAGRRGVYGFAGAKLTWWHGQTTRGTYPGLRLGAGNRFGQAFSLEANLDLGRFRDSSGTEASVSLGAFYKF